MQITINMDNKEKIAFADFVISIVQEQYNSDYETLNITDKDDALDKVEQIIEHYADFITERMQDNVELEAPFSDPYTEYVRTELNAISV